MSDNVYLLIPKNIDEPFGFISNDIIATSDINIIKQHIVDNYENFSEFIIYVDGHWNMYWEFNTGKRMTRRADYCESKEELLEIIDTIKIK